MMIIGTLQKNEIIEDSSRQVFHFKNDGTNDILTLQDLFLLCSQCIPILRSDFFMGTASIFCFSPIYIARLTQLREIPIHQQNCL